MELGEIVLFKSQGGFGFIRPADGSDDVFFHASGLPGKAGRKSIEEGITVTFTRAVHRGRPLARNVVPIRLGNDEPASEEVGNDREN